MEGRELDLLLQDMPPLPTLPNTRARLSKAVSDAARAGFDDASISRALDVAMCDVSACVLLLRRAGAAPAYPLAAPAGREERIALLNELLSLPIAESAPSADGFDQPQYQRHALAVAWTARELSIALALPIEPQEAFVAGLLHDLGKFILAQAFPKAYARVLASAAARDQELSALERSVIGIDHASAGSHAARQWRLGETLAETIWLHHLPPGMAGGALRDQRLVKLVSLASAIPQGDYAYNPSRFSASNRAELADALGLGEGQMAELVERRAAELDRLLADAGLEDAPQDEPAALRHTNAALSALCTSAIVKPHASLESAVAAALPSEAVTTPQVLAALCEVITQRWQFDLPAVAYALAEDGKLLACRQGAGARPDWRSEASAPRAGADMALDLAALDDWLVPQAYSHVALPCGRLACGGVLVPLSAPADCLAQVRQAAQTLGLLLAVAQQSDRSAELCAALAASATDVCSQASDRALKQSAADIAELAGGAAHEINNPLAIISGRAQLMAARATAEDDKRTWTTIADQAQRISDIVTALMNYAAPPSPSVQPVSPRELLTEAVAAFSAEQTQVKPAQVDIEAGEDLPEALADRAIVVQVLHELMTNALNAARGPVSIRLSAGFDHAAQAVILSVADDGPGMDEPTLAQAFTPFFSRQTAGRRRGMGLPLARRHVEAGGGTLWIKSRPNVGTTAFVQLPARM